jgi:probable rRNA maturation factor
LTGAGGGPRVSVRQRIRPAPFRVAALKALVRAAAARLGARGADLRILVVGDAGMERWNRRFRGVSRTTNVLSFPEEEAPGAGGARLAGDILVSAPTCLRETAGWGGSPEERVFFFILHGMLHLTGYDHDRGRAEADRMRRTEARVYREALRDAGRSG